MNEITIYVPIAFRDMLAFSILKMAEDHKKVCEGSECSVVFFPFQKIIQQLLERPLTREEQLILS